MSCMCLKRIKIDLSSDYKNGTLDNTQEVEAKGERDENFDPGT